MTHPYTCEWCDGEWPSKIAYDDHFASLVQKPDHPYQSPSFTLSLPATMSREEWEALRHSIEQYGERVRADERARYAALVEALTAAKLPMVEPVGDRKTDPINSQRASWNAALDFALRAALDGRKQ